MHVFLYTGSDVVDVASVDDVLRHVQGLPFWWLDIGDPPAESGALAADWMVNSVSGPAHFWFLGVGLQIAVIALVFVTGRKLFPVLRGDVQGSPATGLEDSDGPPPSSGG